MRPINSRGKFFSRKTTLSLDFFVRIIYNIFKLVFIKFSAIFREAFMFATKPIQCEIAIKGFNNIYYFELGKEFSHTPERHPFWEMLYVDKGKIVAITDGIGCILEQGQAIFHEPGEVHAHVSDKQHANNMLVVSFTTSDCNMSFFKKKTFTFDDTSRKLLSLFMQEAKHALGDIAGDYNDKRELNFSHEKFGSTQLMQCYFTEFLIKLIRSGSEQSDRFYSTSESRSIAENSTLEMMLDYLEKNIYNDITLGELCDHFFIGKSQLNLLFREYTGVSPMRYYSELKIKEAKKLLREGALSVSEISERLCYSGIHNFSRAFKNVTGYSPIKYKKSIY